MYLAESHLTVTFIVRSLLELGWGLLEVGRKDGGSGLGVVGFDKRLGCPQLSNLPIEQVNGLVGINSERKKQPQRRSRRNGRPGAAAADLGSSFQIFVYEILSSAVLGVGPGPDGQRI